MLDDMTGANGAGVAEPASQQTDSGANGQGVADPAQETTTDGQASGGSGQEGQGGQPADGQGQPGGQTQSLDERRRNAAIRRQREQAAQQAQIEAAQRAAQAKVDATYAQMYQGQANPYTGRPILTEKDYLEYQTQHQAAQAQQQLQKAGIDPAAIGQIIEQSPVVRDLRAKLGQMETVTQAAQLSQGRQLLDSEVKAIAAMDPSVQSLEDILGGPRGAEVMQRASKGMSLGDAYKLTYFDELSGKRAQAARQSAAAQAAGKGHLTPQGQGAAGEGVSLADIPPETLALYRQMNPKKSDAEIIKHYSRNH